VVSHLKQNAQGLLARRRRGATVGAESTPISADRPSPPRTRMLRQQ